MELPYENNRDVFIIIVMVVAITYLPTIVIV